MAWNDLLGKVVSMALPIKEAIETRKLPSLADAWNHPLVKEQRDNLMSTLIREGSAKEFLEAAADFRRRHAELLAKDDLTAVELRQLGTYSAAANVLSAQALADVMRPQAIFLYVMQQVLPIVSKAVQLDLIPGSGAIKALIAVTESKITAVS